jgi:integrase
MAINTNDYPNKVKTNLYASKDYTIFYYNFKKDGKKHRGIVDLSDKNWSKRDRIKHAEYELSKAKEKADNDIDESATVDDIVELYFQNLKEGYYKRDRKSYYVRRVQPRLGKKKAATILPRHVQAIINDNIKTGDSPRTAKQTIEVLSPAFKIARANRLVTHNPCDDVSIKIPKSKKIVVNATERLTQIYKAIMSLYKDDPFYRSFFLLALQGRRKGEILNLRWEHISFEHDYYFLSDTKNGEEQKIFLPPNVKAALLEFRSESGWVFASPLKKGQRIFDAKRQTIKLKQELGDWFTMHYTRNVMVSAMAEQGVDAIYMSGALGHNDPNTITKYLTMNYLQGSRIASNMIEGITD